ncbi:hypothetical protein FAZ19_23585 [Sphingobacterium alkalisoli]|uniref:Uncharacterized protein n=1 Tax=Sphingobacterium alkalisoli TaxID=1874115 RepID=A0A4U0GLM5_9SPHI|nr:hypothetical protein [Sphingobacterium alkalisoli]TJY59690.1 hypothetical protein FAZ19_23585 [Sphingobacterium alkalisoli]GGH33050.1 hypothetical protein GCM10011418_46990 [Sphingobacterium alkalisoli]
MKTKKENLKEKDTERFIAVLQQYKEKVTKNSETSKRFLVDLGVLTETGKRSKNYKHLCIPEAQE